MLPFALASSAPPRRWGYSVGANASHGLRRTNADKRRAVLRLLEDTEWTQWSDREIAKRCAVSQPYVGSLRKDVAPPKKPVATASDNDYQIPEDDSQQTRKAKRKGKTYEQKKGKRGKKRLTKEEREAQEKEARKKREIAELEAAEAAKAREKSEKERAETTRRRHFSVGLIQEPVRTEAQRYLATNYALSDAAPWNAQRNAGNDCRKRSDR